MELNWLRYFYEVARLQSVTQAGQQLRVSQPAVTKAVRQLEGQLGYKLFVKSGRNLRLSVAGERLYQHCVPLFKRVEQIRHLGGASDADWQGAIRLGASDNLTNYIVPKALRTLQKRFPRADWTIYSGSSKEIKQRLISGEVDFGLFYTELSLSEQRLLRETILAQVPFVSVCSPGYGRKIDLARLRKLKLTYVGVRFADYAHTLPEQWIVENLKIGYERSIQANSKETQKRLVLEGAGFGTFPRFMVAQEIKDGSLTLIRGSEQRIGLRVVHRSDETLTVAAQILIQTVKSLL
jgi:DNA-binding transcriptional LysR family regulator